APDLGSSGKPGHLLARPQAHGLEAGSRLLGPGAPERSEELLRAMDHQVGAKDQAGEKLEEIAHGGFLPLSACDALRPPRIRLSAQTFRQAYPGFNEGLRRGPPRARVRRLRRGNE